MRQVSPVGLAAGLGTLLLCSIAANFMSVYACDCSLQAQPVHRRVQDGSPGLAGCTFRHIMAAALAVQLQAFADAWPESSGSQALCLSVCTLGPGLDICCVQPWQGHRWLVAANRGSCTGSTKAGLCRRSAGKLRQPSTVSGVCTSGPSPNFNCVQAAALARPLAALPSASWQLHWQRSDKPLQTQSWRASGPQPAARAGASPTWTSHPALTSAMRVCRSVAHPLRDVAAYLPCKPQGV